MCLLATGGYYPADYSKQYFQGFKEERGTLANGHEIVGYTGGSSELSVPDGGGNVDVRNGPLTLEVEGPRELGKKERA